MEPECLLLHGQGGGFVRPVANPIGVQSGFPNGHAFRVGGHLTQAGARGIIQLPSLGGVDGAGSHHIWVRFGRSQRQLSLRETIADGTDTLHPGSVGPRHKLGDRGRIPRTAGGKVGVRISEVRNIFGRFRHWAGLL